MKKRIWSITSNLVRDHLFIFILDDELLLELFFGSFWSYHLAVQLFIELPAHSISVNGQARGFGWYATSMLLPSKEIDWYGYSYQIPTIRLRGIVFRMIRKISLRRPEKNPTGHTTSVSKIHLPPFHTHYHEITSLSIANLHLCDGHCLDPILYSIDYITIISVSCDHEQRWHIIRHFCLWLRCFRSEPWWQHRSKTWWQWRSL